VIDGLLLQATSPAVCGHTIDLGSGKLVTVCDVVLHLVDIVGTKVGGTIGQMPERPFEHVRWADVANTRARIGVGAEGFAAGGARAYEGVVRRTPMNFTETAVQGPYLIGIEPIDDARGFLAHTCAGASSMPSASKLAWCTAAPPSMKGKARSEARTTTRRHRSRR
jgi:hypothetical protein